MREQGWYQTQIDRITYKPGWSFDISGWDLGGWNLTVRFHPEACTRSPPRVTRFDTISATNRILDGDSEDAEAFQSFVFAAIQAVENHEQREWFKVDGVIVDDPHRGVSA